MNDKLELYHTMNVMVATILLSYGFEVVTFTHIVRDDGKESKDFWFHARSATCPFDAATVAKYATKEWENLHAKDAEHPLLWMRAALLNRNTIIEIIKNAPRMVEISNGSRRALIKEGTSEETKKQIASML